MDKKGRKKKKTRIPFNIEEMCLEEQDLDDELKSVSNNSNNENEDLRDKYIDFNPKKDMNNPIFDVGRRFSTKQEFKDTMTNYVIKEGSAMMFKPSEPHRARAKYKNKDYTWFIFASIEFASKTKDLVIKSMRFKAK